MNQCSLTKQEIENLFNDLKKNNPQPKTELHYQTAFQLLIAVILSAQATDISVNKATPALFALAPDAASMARCSIAEIENLIQHIGLYRNKSKHIVASATILHEQYSGEVPNTRHDLQALPGVGRKTANVILNTWFDQETIAVDTHIFRVAQRIGLAKGKTPEQIESQLMKNIPHAYLKDAHHWLILHGRYVCKARLPQCKDCLIRAYCKFPDKNV
jgi:endonuclease III